jgi:hypothetical protein
VEPKAPLSLRRPALPARLSPACPKAGSVMELPLGEIAGDLHAIAGHGGRSACYELLVANDTPLPLATFAYATEPGQRHDRITWNAILVPPYSAIAVEIDVALPRRGRPLRVVAELHAEDAKLTLDGGPPHRFSRGLARRVALLASALLLLALGTASIAKNEPHVVAIAAPTAVRGGVPFSVAYAAGQASEVDYTVDAADGLEVGRGTLHDGPGAFSLALPTNHVSSGYDIRIFAHGRFGTDERSTHVVALAAPRAAAPKDLRVTGLALDAETVHGGDPIAVSYKTPAQAGYVRLIDEIGTVRAEALLSPHGRSILQAPYVDADQDLRVVVDAQRGTSRAESEVPVRILHADPNFVAQMTAKGTTIVPGISGNQSAADPSDPNDPSSANVPTVPVAAADPDTTGSAPVSDSGGVISVPKHQRLGVPIVVRIAHMEAGLRIAVMGEMGDEIEAVDIASDTDRTILPAITGKPQNLSVVATYAKGFGQETFIQPITVTH